VLGKRSQGQGIFMEAPARVAQQTSHQPTNQPTNQGGKVETRKGGDGKGEKEGSDRGREGLLSAC